MSKQQIKNVAKKVIESNGQLAVSKAMVEEGYPTTTARNPQQITRSKTWIELMEKEMPDEVLAERHRELLDKRETVVVRDGKESHVELTDQPHSDVKGALDMAYKLKGSYAPEKSVTLTITGEVTMTKKEKEIKEEFEERLKKSIQE